MNVHRLASILVLTLCLMTFPGLGDKIPVVGDHIILSVYLGEDSAIRYEGNITGIAGGFICLNCTIATLNIASTSKKLDVDYPLDVCVGTGQVQSLVWAK